MADRRLREAKRAPVPNSLLASARVISTERLPVRIPENWQDDAWRYYETVGELRYAVTYIANGLSRVRLVAARPGTPSNPVPQPITDPEDPAVQAVAALAGGAVGQAGMLSAFGVLLTVPGIGYLVGEPTPSGETWNVYSPEVLRSEGGLYKLQDDDASWRDLAPDSLVVQVWRPDRRRPWMPDSPVHGVLSTLQELELLNQRIIADATSRLAGAGVFVMPTEAEFPPVTRADGSVISGAESFTEALMEMMMRPIGDRESAAAVVPFTVRIPGEYCGAPRLITFATPFDERLLELRDSAIRRLAVGMDLPVESTLGLGDVNHWSAWQISDEAVDLHVDPLMETVCEGITTGYLAPTLMAENEDPTAAVVWYDDSALRTPADQSAKAVEMYDRGEVKGDSMRRESGFTEGDKPTIPELRQQIVVHTLLTRPDLMPNVAPYLDRLSETGLTPGPAPTPPAPAGPGGPGPAVPAGPGSPAPSGGPPPGGPGTPPPPRPAVPTPSGPTPPPASARLPDALLAACDVLVGRALERAGARLDRSGALDRCPEGAVMAGRAHTCIDRTVLASANLDLLLDHAWDRLPEIAVRYEQNPEDMVRFCDNYTRSLLATGTEHTFEVLCAAWGYSS